MSEIDDRKELSDFINKRRKRVTIKEPEVLVELSPEKMPWYKRPLQKNEFRYKLAKNGRWYVRHKEWSPTIWVGPYADMWIAERIIESYVTESLKSTLDKKINSDIHSVIIDNPSEFF